MARYILSTEESGTYVPMFAPEVRLEYSAQSVSSLLWLIHSADHDKEPPWKIAAVQGGAVVAHLPVFVVGICSSSFSNSPFSHFATIRWNVSALALLHVGLVLHGLSWLVLW